MAFGSGAHPSTLLCIELMLNMNIKHKKVVDAGTGSGVLAVLAKKMGAAQVMAFDNNPWAIEIYRKTMKLNNI
ncbi:MAG: 50S ribosomal protein L11 methyltransferase [Prolixibacteraceae bacterium]|nr:50S ribosomal protein L11 methyltransferase [Prolixibacteraceae bacterium]MBN2648678.1 50S ribosomal protein L11 methyltransferase [Prolixibacteraceae bacterium]